MTIGSIKLSWASNDRCSSLSATNGIKADPKQMGENSGQALERKDFELVKVFYHNYKNV